MKYLLLFTISLFGVNAFTQKSNFTITYNKWNTNYSGLYNDHDTIHIIGSTIMKIPYNFRYFHSIYYPNNKMTHTPTYGDSLSGYGCPDINVIKSYNQNYLSCAWAGAVREDSFEKCIMETDRNGKLVKKYEQGNPKLKSAVYFYHIYENKDHSLIVNAQKVYQEPNDVYSILIFKLDENFKTLDSVYVDSFNNINKLDIKQGGLSPMSEGKYRTVINPYRFDCNITNSLFHPQIVEFDQNLKISKSRSISNRQLFIANTYYIDDNSSLIYGFIVDSNICVPNFEVAVGRPYIAMIDSNLNFTWEIDFEKGVGPALLYDVDFCMTRMIQLRDGNFLAIGRYDYPGFDVSKGEYGHSGLLIKFNKKGQILWSKKHRYNESPVLCESSKFSLKDVAELSNGDLFVVGMASVSCPDRDTTISVQRGWILRLDSMGDLLKEDTSHVSIVDATKLNISLYPNPTDYTLNFYNLPSNSKYSIYNQLGQKLISGIYLKDIDISALTIGIYFIQVETKTKSLNFNFEVRK